MCRMPLDHWKRQQADEAAADNLPSYAEEKKTRAASSSVRFPIHTCLAARRV
jgi:hypothetical protein